MQLKTIFKRLGLPKHAPEIYRLLQMKGPLLVFQISKDLHIHRPAIYSTLSTLRKHHFIFTTLEGKRKFYHAANANLIAKEFSQLSAEVSDEFAKRFISRESNLQKEMRFLYGPNGIRDAFDDVVNHTPRGETFYRYTSEKDLDAVNRYLSKDYRARRDAKKLERLVISNPASGKQKRSRLERFIKYIPPEFDFFDQNIIQLAYGNRLSFIDLNSEHVIIIENKALVDFQKVVFKLLYKKLQ
jgi:sugar-specific transcriptional regulator TrmB